MRTRNAITLLAGLILTCSTALAQSNDSKQLNVTVTLDPAPASCQITVSSDLNITGTLPQSGSATYTVDPVTGQPSVTGNATINQSSAPGAFSVSVVNSTNATLTVTAPSTLTKPGSGDTVPFQLLWAKDDGTGTYTQMSGNSDQYTQPGTYSYRVGGSVTANDTQPMGSYQGQIDLSVTCN